MVAIVSGDSLGLSLTSLATLGQDGSGNVSSTGRNGEQAFVNVATGNLVLQDRDEFLVGLGPDAAAVRTYNSQGEITGGIQDSWLTGAARQTVTLSSGTLQAAESTLTRTDRDGAQSLYTWNATSSKYVSTEGAGAYDTITWDSAAGEYAFTDGGTSLVERYDSSGRLVRCTDADGNTLAYAYDVWNRGGPSLMRTTYTNTYTYFEGGRQESQSAISNAEAQLQPGSTHWHYDVNGNLASFEDTTQPDSNRSFVNDANGYALYSDQGGQVQRQLVANGEVLGRFGDTKDGSTTADFNFNFQPVNGNYPASVPTEYMVVAGNSLQSIAKAVYGDERMWYLIADANGLTGNGDLQVGQVLRIPPAIESANTSTTFKPYDPSAIVGDTTPNQTPIPQGDGGCGGLGQVIMIAVAIVVTIYTAGALSGAVTATIGDTFAAGAGVLAGGGTAGSVAAAGAAAAAESTLGVVGTAAVAGAVGSIASQAVGIAIGAQQGFSWKGVALSALQAGVTAGLSPGLGGTSGTFNAAVTRAAVASMASQGVAVVTGLQAHFSWQAVAASAVGAGVAHIVGGATGLNDPKFSQLRFADQFGPRLVTGLAAGAATAIAHGGRVAVQQIAIDAFGNALGSSIADANWGSGEQSEQARNASEFVDAVNGFSRQGYSGNPQPGMQIAANGVQDSSRPLGMSDAGPVGDLTANQIEAMRYRFGPRTPQAATAALQKFGDELGDKVFEGLDGGTWDGPSGSDADSGGFTNDYDEMGNSRGGIVAMPPGNPNAAGYLQELGKAARFMGTMYADSMKGTVNGALDLLEAGTNLFFNGGAMPGDKIGYLPWADPLRFSYSMPQVGQGAEFATQLLAPLGIGKVLGRTSLVAEEAGSVGVSGSSLAVSGEVDALPTMSARERYMGATPDKYSRTGREVVERMRAEGLIEGEGPLLRSNPNDLQLLTPESRVRIDGNVDMAHTINAVTWWNSTGRYFGAKSPEVRQFMLNSDNYVLMPSSINRSAGARLGEQYLPPASPTFFLLKR